MSVCECVCSHRRSVVGIFVNFFIITVGTPNIVGTHCWDSGSKSPKDAEKHFCQFWETVPKMLNNVLKCAECENFVTQPFPLHVGKTFAH